MDGSPKDIPAEIEGIWKGIVRKCRLERNEIQMKNVILEEMGWSHIR